jgi:hypothetical protein
MNIYLRYFDNETLVHNVDEAIDYLSTLSEIEVTPELEEDLRNYVASSVLFPKRYKVRSRVYFIVIKTEAQTMQDFKEKKAVRSKSALVAEAKANEQKRLNEALVGWYEGTLDFKRVIMNHMGKCEYRDTSFTVHCIANSQQDCYNRIVEHLSSRVDKRSQFPAAKGKNFTCRFLGFPKQNSVENI